MNILITGGCGFIGSHIVHHHLGKGDNVHVVDDLSTGSLKNIAPFKNKPRFKFTKADILTWRGLAKAVTWAEQIYHMAAVIGVYRVLAEPLSVFSTNILGCERLLNTIYKNKLRPRVLIASSSSVYGHSNNSLLNEGNDLVIKSAAHPLLGYAISKIMNEGLGLCYYRAANIPITLLRLFNVIGPRQIGRYGMVVPRFIQQACNDEPITIYGDGTQTRSFCDVRDVVAGLALLASNTESEGEIINVGNDTEITINDLAQLVRSRAYSHSEIQYVPYRDAYGTDLSDIRQRRPDLSRFIELSGYVHKWSLAKSIDNLISLYKDRQKSDNI